MPLDDHFQRRDNKAPHGRRAEKRAALRLEGEAVPASGAIEGLKGDIRLGSFLLENKSTINASLSLKQDWLHKIAREATEIGKRPGLSLQFVDKTGQSNPDDRWVCIRECEYQELMEGR